MHDSSFASTNYSETHTPEKDKNNIDVEMIIIDNDIEQKN